MLYRSDFLVVEKVFRNFSGAKQPEQFYTNASAYIQQWKLHFLSLTFMIIGNVYIDTRQVYCAMISLL